MARASAIELTRKETCLQTPTAAVASGPNERTISKSASPRLASNALKRTVGQERLTSGRVFEDTVNLRDD